MERFKFGKGEDGESQWVLSFYLRWSGRSMEEVIHCEELEELKSLTIWREHSKPTGEQSLGPAVAGCVIIQGTIR